MWEYIKTNAAKHVFAIAVVVVVLLAGRSWLEEHDARLQADTKIQTAQTQIADLKAQQTAVAKTATAQVVVLQREAAEVKTAPEAVKALPTVSGALEVQELPEAPGRVSVDALPLYQELNGCRQSEVQLVSCTARMDLETKIEAEKDVEIVALKKKPAFWHRVKQTAITVGIGVAVGYAIHH